MSNSLCFLLEEITFVEVDGGGTEAEIAKLVSKCQGFVVRFVYSACIMNAVAMVC